MDVLVYEPCGRRFVMGFVTHYILTWFCPERLVLCTSFHPILTVAFPSLRRLYHKSYARTYCALLVKTSVRTVNLSIVSVMDVVRDNTLVYSVTAHLVESSRLVRRRKDRSTDPQSKSVFHIYRNHVVS